MSIKNFFYSSYWLSQPLIARGALAWVWFGFFASIVLAGIVLFVLRQYEKDSLKKEVYKRFGVIGLTMGMLGLVWFFFRQERIPFFSWRFWLLPWLPITAWWVYRVIHFTTKRVPVIRAQQLQKSIKDKYLPKRA
jgi:amino acid transporter